MAVAEPVFWAIVPAAGAGTRFGAALPKQYLTIAGQPLLHHTLQRLARVPGLAGIVLVLAPDDTTGRNTEFHLPVPLHRVTGGAERADSVLAGLQWLLDHPGPTAGHTWAMVHDAARPGVRVNDVVALMTHCRTQGQGAILALPARDTVKQSQTRVAGVPTVEATLDRDHIWLAQTPQCFPVRALAEALQSAATTGAHITDEASAMALAGHSVGLVRGHWQNNKLTEPADWPLIEWVLQHND